MPIWDAGTTSRGLIYCATASAPVVLLFAIKLDPAEIYVGIEIRAIGFNYILFIPGF